MINYEPVIGLEIHAQLKTKSKLFCACSTEFGKQPNTQVCEICSGMPGTLPALNKQAVNFAVKLALALESNIQAISYFDRKNYFYPDLPKGYQITQYYHPIGRGGVVRLLSGDGERNIRINRIHLEEDAGKSIHDLQGSNKQTAIDLNRCGVPLVEIVTEPNIHSPAEAASFLKKIKQILIYLKICDGNLEEGSLRCDANISVRKSGETALNPKTEIKNLNSFRHVERALEYEFKRQSTIVKDGGQVKTATLSWDDKDQKTRPIRLKESENDYCYMPEPDLMPLEISKKMSHSLYVQLPELPDTKVKRFSRQYKLSMYEIHLLCETMPQADYFEETCQVCSNYNRVARWTLNMVRRTLNLKNISIQQFPLSSQFLGELLNLIDDGEISEKTAHKVYEVLLHSNKNPAEIVQEKNWQQISDNKYLEALVSKIISENQDQVKLYQSGKKQILNYLVGKVIQDSRGKANPEKVYRILTKFLSSFQRFID